MNLPNGVWRIILNIKQGEIWLVNFNPQIGNEISKTRPAVVIDNDEANKVKMRIVVPITSWRDKFKFISWHIKIDEFESFGLTNLSSFNCHQLKSFSHQRFVKKIGQIDETSLFQVHQTITKIFNFRYHLEKA